MNTYILSFDPHQPEFTAAQLHAFIKQNRDIAQFYNPFPGTYILKSELFQRDLNAGFVSFFNGKMFVLAPVTPFEVGGAFPQAVWDWFNTGDLPKLEKLSS
ncbi:MAG: hypothetical protein QOH04_939 [Sphingomonadales bacterium]|jgi:hypothetical protein|nr:hypothetical protein [Sphingomonadales bacterium]MEA3035180.1 hypothetical protein [Sphingomonadales bacterium]